jgi:hypothetical protein
MNGAVPPTLSLCRSCLQYVYSLDDACPHCGSDPRRESRRYVEGNYRFFEAAKRVEHALERVSQRRAR